MLYHGHLYGHYDSRGGTTFVCSKTATPDRKTADRAFGSSMGWPIGPWPLEGVDEDYLGEATLLVPDSETVANGDDLDGGDDDRAVVVRGTRTPHNPDDFLDGSGPWELVFVPSGTKAPKPSYHPRWDDDAYSFFFVLVD